MSESAMRFYVHGHSMMVWPRILITQKQTNTTIKSRKRKNTFSTFGCSASAGKGTCRNSYILNTSAITFLLTDSFHPSSIYFFTTFLYFRLFQDVLSSPLPMVMTETTVFVKPQENIQKILSSITECIH